MLNADNAPLYKAFGARNLNSRMNAVTPPADGRDLVRRRGFLVETE
jgi:hypothetical protein